MSDLFDYIRTTANDVTPMQIITMKDFYFNIPRLQRGVVWPDWMRKALIDTMLRGLVFPPIIAYRRNNKERKTVLWILDGHQRLSTIIDFIDNKFKTARNASGDDPIPIEPGRSFKELSQAHQDILYSYTLHYTILEDIPDELLGLQFRRLQHELPLLPSEKLHSYISDTTDHAIELLDHIFWSERFVGRTERKRDFQACLYLLYLELNHGYGNINTHTLKRLASGADDNRVTSALMDTIRNRLDGIMHVFSGAQIYSMGEVVPVYQAIIHLEAAGVDLKKSESGCLSPWITKLKKQQLDMSKKGYDNIFRQILKEPFQHQFWADQYNSLINTQGLFILDKKRTFDQKDRLEAYLRQDGKCPHCLKPVTPSDYGHHRVPYGNSGKTNGTNCVLVHKECHAAMDARTYDALFQQLEQEKATS